MVLVPPSVVNLLYTNPKGDYVAFSRNVLIYGKASSCRCSLPTASHDNAVRGLARYGLSLYFSSG